MTPSAVYGLALNLAGIEARLDDGLSAMTITRFNLPPARIALGADANQPLPTVQTVFQQLHNYPVGASGKDRKEDAKGNKYNITPVRREFLAGLCAVVAFDFLEDPQEVEPQIREGFAGKPPRSGLRYGLPFLHDLGYCHRLFYLTEVEGLQAPNASIYAGRELHASIAADEDGERTQLELADPALGLVGKVDAIRRRDGALIPYEHKRGRSRRDDDKTPRAWPSDRLQVVA